jgi:hypothetical protein
LVSNFLTYKSGTDMKKSFYKIIIVFAGIFSFYTGCSEDITPSLYKEPDPTAVPSISAVDPANSAVAGVTEITISGSDFSSDKTKLVVYFNSVPAAILEASPTQLKVQAPNLPSDSIKIQISKIGSISFSNPVQYQLTPAYAEIKRDENGTNLFTENRVPNGITTDAQGNVYVSVKEFNQNIGVKKITLAGILVPYGQLQDFAPPGGAGGSFFSQINLWRDTIIAARRAAAIFQQAEGTVTSVFASQLMQGTLMYDIDFDQNLNVWAGGRGTTSGGGGPSLFRITPERGVKSFSYFNLIKALRIYDNHLYILTTVNDEDIIRRFAILSSDSLGPIEDIFNISQSVLPDSGNAQTTANDFDIAADGDIIIGTTRNEDPIVVVNSDGSSEPLYPGVIPAGTIVSAFAWDPGQYLYLTRQASGSFIQSLFRINMQKPGAPYFGR